MSTVAPVAARQPLGELPNKQQVKQEDGVAKKVAAKPRKTKPKKVKVPPRQRATDVLPKETFVRIMSFLDPPTLLELAVTTKQLRRMLMHGKTDRLKRIWWQAWRNVGLHRQPEQKGYNLQEWAFLMFAKRCISCGIKTQKRPDYITMWRYCADCTRDSDFFDAIEARRKVMDGRFEEPPNPKCVAKHEDNFLMTNFEDKYWDKVKFDIRRQRENFIRARCKDEGYRSWDVERAYREYGEFDFYIKVQLMTDRIWNINKARFLAACKEAQACNARRFAMGAEDPMDDYDYRHTDSENSEDTDLEILEKREWDFIAGRPYKSYKKNDWDSDDE